MGEKTESLILMMNKGVWCEKWRLSAFKDVGGLLRSRCDFYGLGLSRAFYLGVTF